MKVQLLKYITLFTFLFFLRSYDVFAQESYDAANNPRQYYYNNLESATVGDPATFMPGAGSTRSTAATIDIVSNSALNTSKSFSTKALASIGYVQWDFMKSSGAAGLNLNARAYEWEFDYTNVTATAPNDPTPNMTAGVDAWRYWLIANSYTGVNSTLGVYITVVNGNLKIISKYGTASNQWKDYGISIPLATNNHTFQIRALRSIDGYYYIYVLDRNTGVTSISGSYNVGKSESSLDMSTYNYSYLEATSSADNRFQWDNFNFYQPRLDYVPINGPNSGISDPIYPNMGTAIFYGINLKTRGDIILGRFVVNYTGDITKIFNNSASLYERSNTPLSTTGATLLKNNYALQNNGSSNQVDLSDLNKHYYSGGNTDGTTGSVTNYFFTTTVLSTFASNYPTSVTYSVSTAANDTYAPFFSTSPPYTSNSVSSVSAPTANGDVWDWTGANTSWIASGSWKKNTASTTAFPASNTDIVRIGVVAYAGSNQPNLTDDKTIGSLIFGSNNTPTLTIDYAKTLTANSGLTVNSSSAATIQGGTLASTAIFILPSGSSSAIASGSSLTLKSGTIFTNNGTFINTGGTFNIGGTNFLNSNTGVFTIKASGILNVTTQLTNQGTVAIGSSGSAATLNMATGGSFPNTGTVTVGPTSTVNMTGSNASIVNGNSFTLQSDATGSATVGAITSGAIITGNINVQRYISGGQSYSRGYRLISSPVSVSNSSLIYPDLTYISSKTYTTGTGGTGNGFDAAGNPTLYIYRENMAPNGTTFISGNSRGVAKINAGSTFTVDGDSGTYNIPAGNGVLLFFRGDKATTLNPTITTTIATTSTFTATGNLNQGNVVVKNWFTPLSSFLSYTTATANTAVRGFNLVGNPYASSIDWDTWGTSITGANLSNIIYIYNPVLKVYATYMAGSGGVGTNFNGSGANIIPSGQGFFVRANDANPTLTFTEMAKSTSQVASSNLLLSTAPVAAEPTLQYLRLQVVKDSLNRDESLIFFKSDAKPGFVVNEDAEYLKGNSLVNISTQAVDKALAINRLAFPKKSQVIPLNVTITSNGLYQLNMAEVKSIPKLYDVWLMDAYKKDSLDIKNHPVYNFNAATNDATTFGANRFSIVIRQNTAYAYRLLDFTGSKATTEVQLAWKTENEENYTYFTVERSIDGGKTFDVLGSVPAKALGNYSLPDKNPVKGENQYRLKQEDFNGTISYSKIIPIMYSPISNNIPVNAVIVVYPNPVSTTLNLVINKATDRPSYTITITNNIGTVIKTISTSQSEWKGDVSRLLPGNYFVQVINNNDKTIVGNSKFVKL